MKIIKKTTKAECIRRWEEHEAMTRPGFLPGETRSPMFRHLKESFVYEICKLKKEDIILIKTINNDSWKPEDSTIEFNGFLGEALEKAKRNELRQKEILKEYEKSDYGGITFFKNNGSNHLTIIEGNHRIIKLYNQFKDNLYSFLDEVIIVTGDSYPFSW